MPRFRTFQHLSAGFVPGRLKKGAIDLVKTKRAYIFALLLKKAPQKDGAVAQLVEQWTENPCVGGSIPPHTTNKRDSAMRRVPFLF